MTDRVTHLRFVDPYLSQPEEIALPDWDTIPTPIQRALEAQDQLDGQDDDVITYSPLADGPPDHYQIGVRHDNESANLLYRSLWGYQWPFPSNRRAEDNRSEPQRTRLARAFQDEVFSRVAFPILGNLSDVSRWEEARRVLYTTANPRHLCELGAMARIQYQRTHNLDFLRVGEKCLLDARRLTSEIRPDRQSLLRRIDIELSRINPILDQADEALRQEDMRYPYLMDGFTNAVTANLASLQRNHGIVDFIVAVPPSYIQQHPGNIRNTLIEYFRDRSRIELHPSPIHEGGAPTSNAVYQLLPVSVEEIRRSVGGPRTDTIDYVDPERSNRTVFRRNPLDPNTGIQMSYYRVGFRIPDFERALGNQRQKLFDVVLSRGPRTRTIEKGFVIQDFRNRTVREAVAADLHFHVDDYFIRVTMDESLAHSTVTNAREKRDRINRYYASINEHLEQFVEFCNKAYDEGQINGMVLAGDLVDQVAQGPTLEIQSYRDTNVRNLVHILHRFHGPIRLVPGNHDFHNAKHAESKHKRNFVPYNEDLRSLVAEHHDRYLFGPISPGSLEIASIMALIPNTCNPDEWIYYASREINNTSGNPFLYPNDDFMNHHFERISPFDTHSFSLGNGHRLFFWNTENENFNFLQYVRGELPSGSIWNLIRPTLLYVVNQEVNGKGPQPENFVALISELETQSNIARGTAEGENQAEDISLFQHYPAYSRNDGPDRAANADALRGPVADALRLAAWFYRFPSGRPILRTVISSHLHHYGEFVSRIHFRNQDDERNCRRRLELIFAQRNPATIYQDIREVIEDFHIDEDMEIHYVDEPGSNGFPGPIVTQNNQHPQEIEKRWDTLFVNITSEGIPSEDQTGFAVMSFSPEEIDIVPWLQRTGPHANPIIRPASEMEAYRRDLWQEVHDFDPDRRIPPFVARTAPTAMHDQNTGSRPHDILAFLPFLCRNDRFCLNVATGYRSSFRSPNDGFDLGLELLLPLSRNPAHHPNHLEFGAAVFFRTREQYLQSDRVPDARVFLGVQDRAFHGRLGVESIFDSPRGFIELLVPAVIPTIRCGISAGINPADTGTWDIQGSCAAHLTILSHN